MIVNPRSILAYVGDTVTFKCHSKERVSWNFKGGELPSNSEVINSNTSTQMQRLTINNVQLENSGVYKCYTDDETSTKLEDDGVLTVTGKKRQSIVNCKTFE